MATSATIICDICNERVSDAAAFFKVATCRAAVHTTLDVCCVACLVRFAAYVEHGAAAEMESEEQCA